MKAVETFLLFILLIAVGPYPQDVSAIGTEPTETQTDTIKLEGLTTVAPNDETQDEEEITNTPLKLQGSVLMLQLSIESNITVNSSPNDNVQPTFPTSNGSITASEATTEKVDKTGRAAESSIIVDIPDLIPTAEIIADLPLSPTASSLESVSTASELKSNTATRETTQNVVEPKNTTGSPETSSTSESSSKLVTVRSSFQSLSSSTQSTSTNGVQESKSSLGTTSGFHESISESQDAAENQNLDFENTSSIPSNSNSAAESSLPTAIPASTGKTQMPPNSENNSSFSPRIATNSNPDTDTSSQSSFSTAISSTESIPALTVDKTEGTLSPTQLSERTRTVEFTPVTSSVLDLNSLEVTKNATTEQNGDQPPVNSLETDLGDAGNSDSTKATVATNQSELNPTPSVPDAAPISSSIAEMDGPVGASGIVRAPNAGTPDAAEKTETSTGPESIPASTEATPTPPQTDNTSTTSAQSISISESAPATSAIPEIPGEASAPLPCTETGNFPNPVNCLTYISCSGNVTDLLRQEFPCPDRTAFSPVFRRCTRDISPCNDGPSCLYPGSIADPTNPSSYYWCVPSLLGGFHKYHIQCSIDEAFNTLFGRCLLKTPTYGLINPSFGTPNDRDIAKAESKQMKKELKAKAKEEKNRLKMAAKAQADAEKLALKQQKKQKDGVESDD